MGISFEIDTEEGVIYCIAEGKIGLAELQTYVADLRADPNFSRDFVLIIEFRLAQQNITAEEVKALASALPLDNARRLAMVADGPNRDLALRYKELVKEKILVEVFTDFGTARKWVTSSGRAMGIKFEIDLDAGVVFGVATGDFGPEDIRDYIRRLLEDPKYSPELLSLIDARKTNPQFSEEDMRSLAQVRVKTPATKKLAIVAAEAFGHARMFHGWTGNDSNIMIFKEMKTAREWLGLPPEES